MTYEALMDPDLTKFGITWQAKRLSEARTRSAWSAPKSGGIMRWFMPVASSSRMRLLTCSASPNRMSPVVSSSISSRIWAYTARIVREEPASSRVEVAVNGEPPPIDIAKGLALFSVGHYHEVPALPVSSCRCPKSDLQALPDDLRLHRT
jgi:hypothetical protein